MLPKEESERPEGALSKRVHPKLCRRRRWSYAVTRASLDLSTMSRSSLRKPLFGVALLTGALLLLPAIAMRVTDEVSWGPGDFVVAAVLLLAAGTAIVLATRLRSRAHRFGAIGLVTIALLVIWAELAVGLFR